MAGCTWSRVEAEPFGSTLVTYECRLDAGHDGDHDFPTPNTITDAEGNPAKHPDCRFQPFTWKRSGKKWGIEGAVLVCLEHHKPAPCKGHPFYDVYALEAAQTDSRLRERGF